MAPLRAVGKGRRPLHFPRLGPTFQPSDRGLPAWDVDRLVELSSGAERSPEESR